MTAVVAFLRLMTVFGIVIIFVCAHRERTGRMQRGALARALAGYVAFLLFATCCHHGVLKKRASAAITEKAATTRDLAGAVPNLGSVFESSPQQQ